MNVKKNSGPAQMCLGALVHKMPYKKHLHKGGWGGGRGKGIGHSVQIAEMERGAAAGSADAQPQVAQVKPPLKDLPAYLDGGVELFNFAEEGINHYSLEWFFAIQHELMDEWSENDKNGCGNTGFIHNQSSILEAFVKGRLYGLCMLETRMMDENVAPDDPHFMSSDRSGRIRYRDGTRYMTLPIFCAVDDDKRIDILWVAARMRRRGLGTRLVECLKRSEGVTDAVFVEDALPFWQRLGMVTYSTSHAQVVFGKAKDEDDEDDVSDEDWRCDPRRDEDERDWNS